MPEFFVGAHIDKKQQRKQGFPGNITINTKAYFRNYYNLINNHIIVIYRRRAYQAGCIPDNAVRNLLTIPAGNYRSNHDTSRNEYPEDIS